VHKADHNFVLEDFLMAFNEPENRNQKPRDPWKQEPEPGPPDLEELMKKLNDGIGKLFGRGSKPGNGGGSGGDGGQQANPLAWMIVPIALVTIMFMALSAFHTVQEAERGVVLRLGKYDRELKPGLSMTLPAPFERVKKVDVMTVRSTDDEGQILTRDENIVDVKFSVQYRVRNARQFLFSMSDPEDTVRQVAESAVRLVVGSLTMDEILLGGREAIASQTRSSAQQILDRYNVGLEISAVNLQDIRPPEKVRKDFDEAIQAREEAATSINRAETYANGLIPEARGAAAQIVAEATAYREAVVAKATGDAARFTLLLEEYRKAPEVTRQRLYLDTMQLVLERSTKMVVDGDVGKPLLYLPSNSSSGGDLQSQAPVLSPEQLAPVVDESELISTRPERTDRGNR
jgi:modulator of FtsH protease HflK